MHLVAVYRQHPNNSVLIKCRNLNHLIFHRIFGRAKCFSMALSIWGNCIWNTSKLIPIFENACENKYNWFMVHWNLGQRGLWLNIWTRKIYQNHNIWRQTVRFMHNTIKIHPIIHRCIRCFNKLVRVRVYVLFLLRSNLCLETRHSLIRLLFIDRTIRQLDCLKHKTLEIDQKKKKSFFSKIEQKSWEENESGP